MYCSFRSQQTSKLQLISIFAFYYNNNNNHKYSGRKERARAAGEDWKKYDQATLETFLRIHRMKKVWGFDL